MPSATASPSEPRTAMKLAPVANTRSLFARVKASTEPTSTGRAAARRRSAPAGAASNPRNGRSAGRCVSLGAPLAIGGSGHSVTRVTAKGHAGASPASAHRGRAFRRGTGRSVAAPGVTDSLTTVRFQRRASGVSPSPSGIGEPSARRCSLRSGATGGIVSARG